MVPFAKASALFGAAFMAYTNGFELSGYATF